MDHGNSNPSYYYPEDIIYTPEVYLADGSAPAHVNNQAFSQHLYQQQQQQQEQQEQQYSYQRYQRPQHQQLQQQPRPHSHPLSPPVHPSYSIQPRHHSHPPSQTYHQQIHSQLHEQSLACPAPILAERIRASPPRPTRSSPSEASTSYLPSQSDPLAALRNDMQIHAAAAALTQAVGTSGDHYASSAVPRLPPILQVEKQQVTTTATQAASASRRRNEATFRCPVPGCGSTFTRRFNLKGHLRSHTSERPYVCEWEGCGKGFARQHDCKRHFLLHSTKAGTHMCQGCGKSFSRTDALNRHLRSDGGSDCRLRMGGSQASGSGLDLATGSPLGDDSESPSDSTTDGKNTPIRSRPASQ